MKTYAEQNGEPPFNWTEFLLKETHTNEELSEACDLAGCWVTCACGNLCAAIPRYTEKDEGNEELDDLMTTEGMPKDPELARLGSKFFDHVVKMYYLSDNTNGDFKRQALKTLHAIEARSAEILKGLSAPQLTENPT